MEKRRLGDSDLHVSVVAMGCWQLDTGHWGSTEDEVIAAVHAGLKVVGISLITNMAAGILDQPLTHEEVIETGKAAAPRFETVAEGVLKGM